jgi:putative aldouronate transport system substrate-binding protein
MFDKYAELGSKTKWPNVNIWDGFTEDYTEYSAERAAVGNVLRQYLAPLQAGLVSDVDAAVAEFRDKVTAAGLEACREGFKEQWADYCAEYNYQ